MTGMATGDPDAVRAALRDGELSVLVGLPECQWLDVKDGIYPLDSPWGKEELVKDVAAFANGTTGGLLVVGCSTDHRYGEEFVDAVRPVPRAQVDVKRYGDVINERVVPQPQGLATTWVSVDDDRGVLVIDVPVQPVERRLFVIPGPTGRAQASTSSVAVPVRRGDQTIWLKPHEIQRLLAAGLRHERDDRGEVPASLVTQTAATASHEIGEGEPGWKGPFRTAYDELRRRVPVGGAVTAVHRQEPGFVQRLGAAGAGGGWVLCALPRRPVVAVADEIWDALHRAGGGVRGTDVVTALGLPVADQGRGHVVDGRSAAVQLRSGRWGSARLVRSGAGTDWAWEPIPSSDFRVTRDALSWTGGPHPPQLRARAIATLPWAWLEECVISTAGRHDLAERLPVGDLAGAVTALSRRRGVELRLDRWDDGPNRNGPHSLSRSADIALADGRTALSCEVMLALPRAMPDAVVTCAELRVEDIDAWTDALGTSPTAAR